MPRQAELNLPDFYAITPPLEADGTDTPLLEQPACLEWQAGFERLVASGVGLIQLRAKALSEPQLKELVGACRSALAAKRAPAATRILLNGPTALVEDLGLSGIHLPSSALMSLHSRPLSSEYLVGASCHSPEELAHAEAIGVDFACLSPVNPTKGYSAGEILGFERFGEWVAGCRIPVYGLGGLGKADLESVRRVGGHGVAGISAFWG